MSGRFSDAGAIVLLCAAGALAEDVAPRLLIDVRLNERRAMVAGIDAGDIQVGDERGQVRTLAGGEFVGFIAPAEHVRPSPTRGSVLELVDGQRIMGSLVGGEAEEASIWWNHAMLGTLEIPLEEIADIAFTEGGRAALSGEFELEDVVILANGDRIGGFVEQIGDVIVIDDAGTSREIPLRNVGAIVLANPERVMEGAYVWLGDGSVVSLSSAQSSGDGTVRLAATLGVTEDESIAQSGVGEVSVHDIYALAFDAGRLVGLGRLEPAGFEPASDRRWSESPMRGDAATALLGAPVIEIPGPMSVWWDLPRGASRIAFDVELPPSMRTWGDCEIIVEVGESGAWREVSRERLNVERPSARINVSIDGPGLRIRVDEGRYGPIQDRVRIERGLLLIDGR